MANISFDHAQFNETQMFLRPSLQLDWKGLDIWPIW